MLYAAPKLAAFSLQAIQSGLNLQGALLSDYGIQAEGDLHQAMVDVRGLAQVSSSSKGSSGQNQVNSLLPH